ncbi:MAG: phosphate propanoyltransferase [Oscillospiraceae bacterium]|nr:phosphate propanoyltransferase [Oscillospiraceae bacterium]
MNEKLVREVVEAILAKGKQVEEPPTSRDTSGSRQVPVEVSARHIHLCSQDIERLFGQGYELTPVRELSQPGQYLCKERVRLVGAKGQFADVAILGPAREKTQVELSISDARALGAKAPVCMSGDLAQAGDVIIFAGENFISAQGAVIAARGHIHMAPEDALALKISDGESVRVKVRGERPVTFDKITVRVSKDFRLALHLDTDEANACALTSCSVAEILSSCECKKHEVSTVKKAPTQTGQPPALPDKLITETVAKKLAVSGVKSISLKRGAVVTPLARDIFRRAGIEVDREVEKP